MFKKIITLCFLLPINLALASDEKNTPATDPVPASIDLEALKALQKDLSGFTYLSLDYANTRSKKIRNKTTTSKGKAFFSKPNFFRWVKTESEVIYNGDSFFQYSPEDKAAVQFNISQGDGKQIHQLMNLFLNFNELQNLYEIKEFKNSGEVAELKLVPKTKIEDLRHVDVKIDTKNKHLMSIRMQMRDTFSSFEFSNHNHEKIAEGAFALPKGTKINKF